MKIEKIEINNFRNYYGTHSFNLDKSITILFGENGYGKSTFFDAIEWCITNEIERFKAQDGELGFNNYDCVNNIAKQGVDPVCQVTIYYGEYRLLRKYNANTNHTGVFLYKFENQSDVLVAQGQKNVENELYKYKGHMKNGGSKLIKHSYVLSQDQITNFIRSNPKERFDSLASIMGINKITNFIDNLKISNSFTKSKYEKFKIELSTNKKLIESRINDREEYNHLKHKINTTIGSLENIKIIDIQKEKEPSLETIDTNINEISNKLAKERQKIKELKKIPSDFSNYNDLKMKQLTLENEYELKINLLTKAKESKITANKEIDGLKSSLKRINEEQDLLLTIENKKNEISKTRDEVNEKKLGDLTSELIQKKLNDFRKKLQVVDFTLLYIEEYQKAKKDCIEIPNMIEEYEKEVSILQGKINSRTKLLASLKKWLNENNASSSLQGLIQYLEGISDYVKNNDVQGTCPVCSTFIGDSLENKINHNIIQHTSKVSNIELLVVRAFELQERRANELSLIQQKFRSLEQKITKLKRSVESSSDILENTSLNTQFDYNLFNINKDDLMKSKTKLTEEIHTLEIFREKKLKLQTLESNYKTLLESLKLKNGEGQLENIVKSKEKILNRKLVRLNKLIENTTEGIEKIKKERDTTLLYISNISNIGNITFGDSEFAVIIDQIDMEVKSLEVDFQLIGKIKELVIKKNEKKVSINTLVGHEKKENELIIEMEKWNRKVVKLDEYIKNLTTEVGENALEFLNHPHSKIQQYYRYLNPMPTTNGNIKFVTDNTDETKRGLSITIPYQKVNGDQELMNARFTLSSAQLNALAISIFLVVNDSQDVGIFNFVAIDDPIQNMDDVNQYTMCDILGDIKKQLLFSTHDLEFLKLFIKKNEYKKQDIRVYFLETPTLMEGRVKEVTF